MMRMEGDGSISFYNRNQDLSDKKNNFTNEELKGFRKMKINSNGKVNIGNKVPNGGNQDYLLSVDGRIFSKRLTILESSAWADFVFDKDYKMQSLTELEQYLKINRHLPNIPSAKEIKENGIDVYEMLNLQMQKIEELHLRIIELNNKLNNKNEK